MRWSPCPWLVGLGQKRRTPGKIDGHYDAFLTVDELVAQSETVKGLRFRILILKARSNKIEDLRPLVPIMFAALLAAKPGTVTSVP